MKTGHLSSDGFNPQSSRTRQIRKLVRTIIRNLLRCEEFVLRLKNTEQLPTFGNSLSLEMLDLFGKPPSREEDKPPNTETEKRLRKLRVLVAQTIIPAPTGSRRLTLPHPFARNLVFLGQAVGLSEVEREVLKFSVAAALSGTVDAIREFIAKRPFAAMVEMIAAAVDLPMEVVQEVLRPDGRLAKLGIIELSPASYKSSQMELEEPTKSLIQSTRLTKARFVEAIAPLASAPRLNLVNFNHMTREVSTCLKYLGAALDAGEVGVNVLLHGVPGTGKTEMAKLIARRLGARLHVIGARKDGGPPSPYERVRALQWAQEIVAEDRRTIFLLDESEDIFRNTETSPEKAGRDQPISKAFLNELLDRMPAPCIWVSNALPSDKAFRRRMRFSITFKMPRERVRRQLWVQACHDLPGIDSDAMAALSHKYQAQPALIVDSVRAALLVAGDRPVTTGEIEDFLKPAVLLQEGDVREGPFQHALDNRFDPASCNVDQKLADLADRLADMLPNPGKRTVLFSGFPGTGKTAACHWLSQQLGREIIVRDVASLESCYVGESEKLIKEAFEEAHELDAALCLDEIDTFISDRRSARYQYERSRCNNFLQLLEAYRGIPA